MLRADEPYLKLMRLRLIFSNNYYQNFIVKQNNIFTIKNSKVIYIWIDKDFFKDLSKLVNLDKNIYFDKKNIITYMYYFQFIFKYNFL